MLSVIIPSYHELENIHRAADKISELLDGQEIPYELLFVNDGSADETWACIEKEAADRKNVRGLCFSRNFGKESAIFAGLANAEGDCAVVIDCDLQHPPEKIIEMYNLWKEGYDIVEGVKASRGEESCFHSFAAKCFYGMISDAVGMDMSRASDFKLMDRKVINALLTMREKNVFFRALSFWVGYKTISVEFDVQPRTEGESKWSVMSLVKYAFSNISSFSTAPMQIVTILGCVMLIASVIFGGISLVQKITGVALGGFTTVILLQLFIGSITMLSLGVIGYYISKIYEEIIGRPRYIISETCGREKNCEETI